MGKTSKKCRRWQGSPDEAGRRTSIYLGPCSEGDYREISGHLKNLERAKRLGVQMTAATAAWLESIGDDLREKIAGQGLCASRAGRKEVQQSIAKYVADYIERRADVGFRTKNNLRQSEARLVEHFGKMRTMQSVTVGDAKAFRHWLEGQGYAVATISMFIKKARQFFADAVDRELLAKNPFKAVKAGVQVNAARMRYVPVATVEAVMAKAPSLQCKLVLALARYAGLRCPSELVSLTWADVNFEDNKIHLCSSKTKKQGKGERFVPINVRLASLLTKALSAAPERSQKVVLGIDDSTNMRTQIERFCEAAGVSPWPKALQNLRLSCETDWMVSDGVALACKWSGNTPEVAMRHYHLVRDEDFERVRLRSADSSAERCRTEGNEGEPPKSTATASEGNSSTCTPMHSGSLAVAANSVPPRGVEPLSSG